MDRLTVNDWIAVGTVLTAAGTIALALIAAITAKIAVRELKQSKNLADAAVRRQRAEVTQAAVRRFIKLYNVQHQVMLTEARNITQNREKIIPRYKRTGKDADFARCRINDLFTSELIKAGRTPEPALNALQACLDSLEELGVGVEMRVYDERVIYHTIRSTVSLLVSWSQHFINLQRQGGLENRGAQPSAYEMLHLLEKRLIRIADEGAPTKLTGALDD